MKTAVPTVLLKWRHACEPKPDQTGHEGRRCNNSGRHLLPIWDWVHGPTGGDSE